MWPLLKDEIRNFNLRIAGIVTAALLILLGGTCLIAFFATLKPFAFILFAMMVTGIWSLSYFVTVNIYRKRFTVRLTLNS